MKARDLIDVLNEGSSAGLGIFADISQGEATDAWRGMARLKKAMAIASLAITAASAFAENRITPIILSRPEHSAPESPLKSDFKELPGPCPRIEPSAALGTCPEAVGRDDAMADIDTFFTLLRWCYAGYFDFGGDSAFGPAKERIRSSIDKAEESVSPEFLESIVARELSFVTDGHLCFGNARFRPERVVCIDETLSFEADSGAYYLVEASGRKRVLSVDGQSPESHIRLSIDDGGNLVYRLVHYGPSSGKDFDAKNLRANLRLEVEKGRGSTEFRTVAVPMVRSTTQETGPDGVAEGCFAADETGPTRVLKLRSLLPRDADGEAQLGRFVEYGSAMKKESSLIMDLRMDQGGSDSWCSQFMERFIGYYPNPYSVMADRRSALMREFMRVDAFGQRRGGLQKKILDMLEYRRFVVPENRGGAWGIKKMRAKIHKDGTARQLVLVVTDRGVASSAEGMVGSLRMMANVVQIGTPTLGCVAYGNIRAFVLPKSKIVIYIPRTLFAIRASTKESVGFEPDIWVPADKALGRSKALFARYGEAAIRAAIKITAQ